MPFRRDWAANELDGTTRGGRTPDTAASKILWRTGDKSRNDTAVVISPQRTSPPGTPERLNRVRRHSPPAERHTGVPYEIAF